MRSSPSNNRMATHWELGNSGKTSCNLRGQPVNRSAQFRRPALDANRLTGQFPRRHAVNRLQQLGQALAKPCAGRDDGHAQLSGKLLVVDRQSVSPGLVHQIQTDDRPVRDLQYLQHEIQIAVQSCRIHDNNRHVRPAKQDEVAGNLFVVACRQQRIGPGQIDDAITLLFERAGSLRREPLSCRANCRYAAAAR